MTRFFPINSIPEDKAPVNFPSLLTEEDKKYYENFEKYRSDIIKLNPKENTKLIHYLKRVRNREILIRLAEYSEEIRGFCTQKNMNPFWDETWSLMGMRPTYEEAQDDPELKYCKLIPQVGISSIDLAIGMFYYKEAKREYHQGHSTFAIQLLEKAAEYKCFEAIKALTELNYEKLNSNETINSSDLKEMISLIEKCIIPHGTPAFLLLASISFYINEYHRTRKDFSAANASLECALIYLYAAAFSKDASKDAIHNAYNGFKIAEFMDLSIHTDRLFDEAHEYCETYGISKNIDLMARGRNLAVKSFIEWNVEFKKSSADTIEAVKAEECSSTFAFN